VLPKAAFRPGRRDLKRSAEARLPGSAELDAIVLPYPIGAVRSQIWAAPVEREYIEKSNVTSHFKTYYKYLCEDIR
jgi:hypothetical protein